MLPNFVSLLNVLCKRADKNQELCGFFLCLTYYLVFSPLKLLLYFCVALKPYESVY